MITAVQDPSAIAGRILDAMPFAVIGLSRRDAVTFVNPAGETLLARSAPLLRGRPLTDILPQDAPLLDFIGRARREGGVMSARSIRLASPHIAPVDLDVSASPDGEDGGLVLTFHPQARTGQEETNAEVTAFAPLGGSIAHVRFRYLDDRQWRNDYDSLGRDRLPTAIEVAVWFNPWPSDEVNNAGASANERGPLDDEPATQPAFDDEHDPDVNAEIDAAKPPPPDRVRVIVIPDGGAESTLEEGDE